MHEDLHITTHNGKMKGIESISTSCLLNPYCRNRQTWEGAVCQKCYSKKYLSLRPSLREKLVTNTELLSEQLLEDSDFPLLNAYVFRLESFGDLVNETQLKNYIALCNKNPHVNFALWTKNLWICENVFTNQMILKPNNLVIIYSSEFLNKAADIDRCIHWYVDHVFTVFTKEFVKDNDIYINCGAAKCLACLLCYSKDTEFYINEILK